jgi:hypothetical protein
MPDKRQWLQYSALLYALGLALHTADHLRRGTDVVTTQVLWVGNISTLVGIMVAVFVIIGNRHGPLLAAATGIPVALGVAAVHLLPRWSDLSDSFLGAHNTGVTGLSWTVVLIEIVGAAAMGVAGIAVTRDEAHTRRL